MPAHPPSTRLVQPGEVKQIQLCIHGRDPPPKHHPARTRHRQQVPIPRRLGGIGGQGAVGAVGAQDLAWERWNRCNHFRGITLKDIKPDGQIWVWQADGGEISAWRACDSAVRAEQAKGAKAAIPPSALAVASPSPNGMTEAPVWKTGYEWAYRYESPTGNGTFVWTVDREEALDGVPHYILKTGTREIFHRKSDFATTRPTCRNHPRCRCPGRGGHVTEP
jgi:hypothetical protein